MPAVQLRVTKQRAIPDSVRALLQSHLLKLKAEPSTTFSTQLEQLFGILIEPILQLETQEAPRVPWALVHPEQRVRCRYYDNHWRHRPRGPGTETKIRIADLDEVFPVPGFEAAYEEIRKSGTHLSVVRNTARFDYGALVINELHIHLYVVIDEMFEVRLTMRCPFEPKGKHLYSHFFQV
eukprot:Skav201733  [mRNA]  locus=scaffold311:738559:739098:- [translate_table: standard]